MLASLSGSAVLVYLIPKYELVSTSTFFITVALLSVFVSFAFYWKMVMSNQSKPQEKVAPLSLRDD